MFVSEVQNIPVCANAVRGKFLISKDLLGKLLGEIFQITNQVKSMEGFSKSGLT
jgi:hypothetical protein